LITYWLFLQPYQHIIIVSLLSVSAIVSAGVASSPDDEVIIIDDGSIDNTEEALFVLKTIFSAYDLHPRGRCSR
jgi:hypothetical protein